MITNRGSIALNRARASVLGTRPILKSLKQRDDSLNCIPLSPINMTSKLQLIDVDVFVFHKSRQQPFLQLLWVGEPAI